jgi:hypothetical protein
MKVTSQICLLTCFAIAPIGEHELAFVVGAPQLIGLSGRRKWRSICSAARNLTACPVIAMGPIRRPFRDWFAAASAPAANVAVTPERVVSCRVELSFLNSRMLRTLSHGVRSDSEPRYERPRDRAKDHNEPRRRLPHEQQ